MAGEDHEDGSPCTAEHNVNGGGETKKMMKPRLSEMDIKFILAMKSEPYPDPGDAEMVAFTEKFNAEWDEFRAGVAEEYRAKGYAEVDDDYFAERAKSEAWLKEQWATFDFSKLNLIEHPEELEGFMVDQPGIVHYYCQDHYTEEEGEEDQGVNPDSN